MLANVFDITSCFRLSLPCGGRRDVFASRLNVWRFQSTPSVWRATVYPDIEAVFVDTFQSTPSVGRATRRRNNSAGRRGLFQSTPSVGRATREHSGRARIVKFQSTPSVGRATILIIYLITTVTIISIHALRGEGDQTMSLCA